MNAQRVTPRKQKTLPRRITNEMVRVHPHLSTLAGRLDEYEATAMAVYIGQIEMRLAQNAPFSSSRFSPMDLYHLGRVARGDVWRGS